MSEYKFMGTPGPWSIGPNTANTGLALNSRGVWLEFATFYQHELKGEQHIHNARLCAAAPVLLEACIMMYDAFKSRANTHSVNDMEVMHTAQQAIETALNLTSKP